MNTQENKAQVISRRKLLKALSAVGGAVVLTRIPSQWVAPMVEVGTLPAHAQGSTLPQGPSAPTISNLTVSGPQGACNPGNGVAGQLHTVSFNYSDRDGDVAIGQSMVRLEFRYTPSGSTDSDETIITNTNVSGTGSQGSISVVACIGSPNGTDTGVNISATLTDKTGRRSNNNSVNISL